MKFAYKMSSSSKYALFFLFLLITAFLIQSNISVYPDEVAYQIFLERYFINGGMKSSVTPYCSEGFLITLPNAMKVPAFFWSILSLFQSIFAIRIFIFSLILLAFLSLYLNMRKINYINYIWLPFLFLAGVTNYSLIILRPEVFIFISLILLFSIAFFLSSNNKISHGKVFYLSASIIVIFSLVGYVHPKSLYLILPSFILLIWTYLKSNRIFSCLLITLISLFTLTFLAYSLIQMHTITFLSCQNFPSIENIMKSQSLSIVDSVHSFKDFFNKLISFNNKENFLNTIHRMSFWDNYQINYLPEFPAKNIFIMIIRYLSYATIFLVIANILILILNQLRNLISLKKISFEGLFFLSCASLPAFWFFLDNTKNWYNISLLLSVLGILAFFGSTLEKVNIENFLTKINRKIIMWLSFLLPLIIVSSLLINYVYIHQKFKGGFKAASLYSNSDSNDLSLFMKNNFLEIQNKKSTPLVVDDLTYESFKDNKIIYPITYLMFGESLQKGVINFVGKKNDLRGVTSCLYLNSFNHLHNIKIINKKTLIIDTNTSYDICYWESRK